MLQGRTVWIVIALMLLLDAYVFQVVRFLTSHSGSRTRLGIDIAYWVVALAVVFCISILPTITSSVVRSYLMAIILGLFLAKLLACLFFLADDFRRLVQWMVGKLFFHKTEGEAVAGEQVSRSAFVSWLGMAVGGTLFGTLVYGFRNKYNYHIRRVTLSFPNLPEGFQGFRFVQLSDIHSGSFNDKAAVEHGIDLTRAERPDWSLFPGAL